MELFSLYMNYSKQYSIPERAKASDLQMLLTRKWTRYGPFSLEYLFFSHLFKYIINGETLFYRAVFKFDAISGSDEMYSFDLKNNLFFLKLELCDQQLVSKQKFKADNVFSLIDEGLPDFVIHDALNKIVNDFKYILK